MKRVTGSLNVEKVSSRVPPLRKSIFQNSLFHFLHEDIFHKIRLLRINMYETLKYNGKLL